MGRTDRSDVGAPLADILDEARRIVVLARERDLTLRLLGGVAIRLRCPSATHHALSRRYADIDLPGLGKESTRVQRFFVELDYVPRDVFNAMYGYERLVFNDLAHARRVDIFLDHFKMCHRFDFRDRLKLDPLTVPLSDLLATKLQVVEVTRREYLDTIALLHDHDIADAQDGDQIDVTYIVKLASEGWGVYKTFTTNLERLNAFLDESELEKDVTMDVRNKVSALRERIEQSPKSVRWKMRARIGERARWYELPEPDKEIVDPRAPR